ncbi:hypothetical protein ON010_g13564 [Phytophthora cinnamomi]|nr:hypothetical protein ON010_g13564 [Phytophthora cinnamomi]
MWPRVHQLRQAGLPHGLECQVQVVDLGHVLVVAPAAVPEHQEVSHACCVLCTRVELDGKDLGRGGSAVDLVGGGTVRHIDRHRPSCRSSRVARSPWRRWGRGALRAHAPGHARGTPAPAPWWSRAAPGWA